jgi:lactate dehydrogenase-like 2-hydroxyacid dehydrogenase
MPSKVFVTRRIPAAGLDRVTAACDAGVWEDRLPPAYDILLQRVQGVEGLLTMLSDRVDAALMDAAGPRLKVISQYAVGVDNIDLAAARSRGIRVGHTPGVLTAATADMAFALLLATARRLAEAAAYVRAGQWQTWEPMTLLGADLSGATLGIVGLGRIGTAVARRAAGFELRVIAHDPSATPEHAASVGVALVDLEPLLRESDFVSLHVPLTPATRHLINRDTLRLMKPTAILINTARGPVVDQRALYDALASGVIAAAGLDVTDPEPMPTDDPLLGLPNALIAPHLGSASVLTRERMAVIASDNLLAGLAGQPLRHEVPAR